MAYVISVFFILTNQIFMFQRKHCKVIGVLFLVFCWMLFWSNDYNPDYTAYLMAFNKQLSYGYFEVGFIYLMKISKNIGMSYNVFLMFWSAIGLIFIHKTVARYTDNYNLVYVLYFLMPFFFNTIIVRNFMVMAVFIYSTKYLLVDTRLSKIKYCLILLLASTIHAASFAYVPLVFLNVRKRNFFTTLLVIFSFLASFIVFFLNRNFNFIINIVQNTTIKQIGIYLKSTARFGFVIFWGAHIVNWAMAYISLKSCAINIKAITENQNVYDNIKFQFVRLNYFIHKVYFVLFPFMMVNSNFNRLLNNIMLLNYISIAITLRIIINKKERIRYIIALLIYIIFVFVYYSILNFNFVSRPILENNIFVWS